MRARFVMSFKLTSKLPLIAPLIILALLTSALESVCVLAQAPKSLSAPRKEAPYDKRAVEAYNEGVKALSNNQLDEAINHYKEALRHDSRVWEAWEEMGTAYEVEKRYDDAKTCADEAIELTQGDPVSHANALGRLAELYTKMGQNDSAESIFKEILTSGVKGEARQNCVKEYGKLLRNENRADEAQKLESGLKSH